MESDLSNLSWSRFTRCREHSWEFVDRRARGTTDAIKELILLHFDMLKNYLVNKLDNRNENYCGNTSRYTADQ